MSIKNTRENERSSLPENREYCYGGFYINLRQMIMQARKFTAKAFMPSYGIVDVTNDKTSNNGLRIIMGVNRREPDEADTIFFTRETLEDIGLDYRKMTKRTPEPHPEEASGVYRKIDPAVLERIMKEPPLDDAG